MMAAICRIFSCKSKKNDQEMEEKPQVKTKQGNFKPEYKQVNKRKTASMEEVIESITHIHNRVRYTTEPNYRYMIPFSFFDKIGTMHKNKKYFYTEIQNSQFLQKSKKFLKHSIDTSEIVLVSREILDSLLQGVDMDYVIKLPYKGDDGFKMGLKEIKILREDQLYSEKKERVRNFDKENNIEKGILWCKDMKIEFINDLGEDSTVNKRGDLGDDDESEKREIKEKRKGEEIDVDRQNLDMNNQIIKISSASKLKKRRFFKKSEKNGGDDRDNTDNEVDEDANYKQKGKNIYTKKPETNKNNNKTSSISEKSTTITKKSGNSSSTSYINKLESLDHLNLPPKGLYNPSVYCFMNTCMQCLASIPELNSYFASGAFNADKKSKKGTTYSNALKDFIESYEDSESSFKAPSSVYKACHSFLEPNQQHDCQEFLRRFLSKIQEELNYNKKYTFPDKISFDKAWNIYKEINPSFIDTLFAGLMRSSVICNKCGAKSDTYDPFLDLSVPIKKKPVEYLENCLDNYFAKEHIDCEYKCSSCKKKTSITKKLEIVVSPPILTLHFKRFEDLHHKFNGSIKFPDTIDLLTYTSQEVHESLHYELFAVAVHLGRSIFSGHYVAYAKRNGKWYQFNDSSVFPADVEEALSDNAYILFYRRVE